VSHGSPAPEGCEALAAENDRLRAALEEAARVRERETEERVRAQEELAAAKWLLERKNQTLKNLDRAKDAFLANLAHELRNPLSSIQGYLEFLAEGELSEERRHFTEAIERNAQHLLSLVEDLLSAARIQSGMRDLLAEPVDLSALVAECVEDAQSRAADKQLRLSLETGGELVVSGDRTRLRQAVSNLLSNAIKFTPAGGSVKAVVRRAEERVTFEVTDTGVGIAPEEFPHLFERFYRTSGAAGVSGTGLGLAIVHAIVDGHGGSVEVESRVGRGTTFRVDLPLARDAFVLAQPAPAGAPLR
jgi:signal transduction histidine kinase